MSRLPHHKEEIHMDDHPTHWNCPDYLPLSKDGITKYGVYVPPYCGNASDVKVAA